MLCSSRTTGRGPPHSLLLLSRNGAQGRGLLRPDVPLDGLQVPQALVPQAVKVLHPGGPAGLLKACARGTALGGDLRPWLASGLAKEVHALVVLVASLQEGAKTTGTRASGQRPGGFGASRPAGVGAATLGTAADACGSRQVLSLLAAAPPESMESAIEREAP